MTTIYTDASAKFVEFNINELFTVLRRNILDDIITGKNIHCGYYMNNPFYDNIGGISNELGQDIGFDNMERIITTYHINEFYGLRAKNPLSTSFSYYSNKIRVNDNNLISSDIIIFDDAYDDNDNTDPKPAIIYDKRDGLNHEDIIKTINDLALFIDNEKIIYVNKYFNCNDEYNENENKLFNKNNIYVVCAPDEDVETSICLDECSYIGFIGVDDFDISYMETFNKVIKLFIDKIENEIEEQERKRNRRTRIYNQPQKETEENEEHTEEEQQTEYNDEFDQCDYYEQFNDDYV